MDQSIEIKGTANESETCRIYLACKQGLGRRLCLPEESIINR